MAAATDDYASYVVPPHGPCRHAAAVTPSDTTDLSDVTRFLYVGGAGAVVVIMQDGTTVTLAAVPAGTVLPIAVSRVKSTGTAATSIVAFW